MAAIKAYFYKLREDMPDVCEGVDIRGYIDGLCRTFNSKSLADIDPAKPLPDGPVYYSDAPRNCHENSTKYEIEDAISDCLRLFDKKGAAKQALAELIADRIMADSEFRGRVMAYNRVPQSWSEVLDPIDPEELPDRDKLVEMLTGLQDRDFRHPNNARGKRHPLARIMESKVIKPHEKLDFVADYFIGRKKGNEAPWAVRLGSRGNYTELNRAHWLEQNGAFVLETVGDIARLKEHFTATNKLKRGAFPDLPQLEPGALKLGL
ncbi:MAG: hypothetical protein H6867_06960 [Rhodospirillales bacterium]|nr:hypothetical protein [Rhodospirillales bacterium]MCB9995289.1 hypothetical protein [Rhodospirillales bacterium]